MISATESPNAKRSGSSPPAAEQRSPKPSPTRSDSGAAAGDSTYSDVECVPPPPKESAASRSISVKSTTTVGGATVSHGGGGLISRVPAHDGHHSSGGAGTSDAVTPQANHNSTGSKASSSKPPTQRKLLLQSTLSFSDGTTAEIQGLRKDLADRDARIEELQAKLRDAEILIATQERAKHVTESTAEELAMRLQRYQETSRQLMIESARTQRREARRWQHAQHFELGHIASAHNPINGLHEVWIEGNTFRRLHTQLVDIRARIRELESIKKQRPRLSSTTSASLLGGGGGGGVAAAPSSTRADEDAVAHDVDDEIRRMEVTVLRTQEQQLQVQLAQHNVDKDAFVKEVRRICDEDASPFALLETIGPMLVSPDAGELASLQPPPQQPQRYQERYVLLCLLGKGGFSEVWKAFDLFEGRYVACKVHKVNHQWSGAAQKNYLKHAERELEIQRQLDHPRLMKLYDVFQMDSTTFVSVMEYSAGEDLEKRLKRCRVLREAEAKVIMFQILCALKHLGEQEQPVIHYDLKPANILFHSPLPSCLEVKVTDFGLSKVIENATEQLRGGRSNNPSIELTSQQCGTFWYLPPECFQAGAKVTPKVDVWAAGIIFYQMLFGKRPFAADASQAEIYNNKLIVTLAKKGVEFPSKPFTSNEAKAIITRCLCYDVNARPDVSTLVHDPYFATTKKRTRSVGAATLALPSSQQPQPQRSSASTDGATMLPPQQG